MVALRRLVHPDAKIGCLPAQQLLSLTTVYEHHKSSLLSLEETPLSQGSRRIMLSDQRKECLEQIQWNQSGPHEQSDHEISVLECWKSEGVVEPVENQNYRLINLCCAETGDNITVEEKIERWLKWQAPFRPLVPSGGAAISSGGIRLIFCKRPSRDPSMSISENAYLKIEGEFHLHSATLPSFFAMNGTYGIFVDSQSKNSASLDNIRVVVRLPQKVEIGNNTLSLHYDVSTGWTNAFICGQRLLDRSSHDQRYGRQFVQLINAIIAEPKSWDDALFLPSILLQNYIHRLQLRSHNINETLTNLETDIGVTFAGAAGYQYERGRWPQDIDPKTTTIDLHSVATQIIFLSSCCQWARDYAVFLLKATQKVEDAIPKMNPRVNVRDASQHIEYLLNTSETIQTRYSTFKDRANLQTNVLFSIINQQATIITQRDMQLSFRIAKSGKQDSISMTTFTFLTALFLPGTFISAMFSMGMFNWQKDDDISNTDTTPSKQQSYVATNFWIYWAVTLPLTLLTMCSWYLWSRYANEKWLEELKNAATLPESKPNSAEKPITDPTNRAQPIWNR